MEINIDIMQDASEIVHYDTLGIPLYMRRDDLTEYPGMRALCHWHEDIEFIRITKGRMYYQINGTKILLNEHDCLIVNSRQMHYGYSVHNENCLFTCILFHPGLLTGNHLMYEKYVLPYLENPDFEFIHFENGNYLHDEISDLLDRIAELKESGFPGFQLEISGYMSVLWARLLKEKLLKPLRTHDTAHTDLTLSRDMVSYVYAHYPDRLTLADIAASANVSRSKCCQIFKHFLQQSPIDFLNHYRLKVSCNLLKNTTLSITDIALSCGFNHLSYYSKLFIRSYGCTPSEYRKSSSHL